MHAPDPTQFRCLVCGFSEVRTDEVIDRGVMFLGWCPRCDHRWSVQEPGPQPATLCAPSLPTLAALSSR